MATREECKTAIVAKVCSLQGVKIMDLAADVDLVLMVVNGGFDFVELVEELIADDEIEELEYVLPDMNWRVKSILFPVGTIVYEPGANRQPTRLAEKHDTKRSH